MALPRALSRTIIRIQHVWPANRRIHPLLRPRRPGPCTHLRSTTGVEVPGKRKSRRVHRGVVSRSALRPLSALAPASRVRRAATATCPRPREGSSRGPRAHHRLHACRACRPRPRGASLASLWLPTNTRVLGSHCSCPLRARRTPRIMHECLSSPLLAVTEALRHGHQALE